MPHCFVGICNRDCTFFPSCAPIRMTFEETRWWVRLKLFFSCCWPTVGLLLLLPVLLRHWHFANGDFSLLPQPQTQHHHSALIWQQVKAPLCKLMWTSKITADGGCNCGTFKMSQGAILLMSEAPLSPDRIMLRLLLKYQTLVLSFPRPLRARYRYRFPHIQIRPCFFYPLLHEWFLLSVGTHRWYFATPTEEMPSQWGSPLTQPEIFFFFFFVPHDLHRFFFSSRPYLHLLCLWQKGETAAVWRNTGANCFLLLQNSYFFRRLNSCWWQTLVWKQELKFYCCGQKTRHVKSSCLRAC